MQKIAFGKTNIEVPRISIGTGTYGAKGASSQAEVSPDYYAIILQKAFERGINFWDTSDDYGTYAHIARALKSIKRENVIIATKTHAAAEEDMYVAIENTLKELNTDYIDIFLMHEVDCLREYHRRFPGLNRMHKFKEKGVIKAVGASTHSINSLEFLVNLSELDVILTNFNMDEIHMDAGIKHYSKALEIAHGNGKGVYVMKVLGEGKIAHKFDEAVKFVLDQPFIHSACVGINTMDEVDDLIRAGTGIKGQGSG